MHFSKTRQEVQDKAESSSGDEFVKSVDGDLTELVRQLKVDRAGLVKILKRRGWVPVGGRRRERRR